MLNKDVVYRKAIHGFDEANVWRRQEGDQQVARKQRRRGMIWFYAEIVAPGRGVQGSGVVCCGTNLVAVPWREEGGGNPGCIGG